MKRKNDNPTVGVLHFYVTSFSRDFRKPESSQSLYGLTPTDQWKFHIARSTISLPTPGMKSEGSGSKNRSMASLMFSKASSLVLPCDQQPFNEGTLAT